MILKDILEKSTQYFREKGFPSPRLDAELLLGQALSLGRVQIYLSFERPLSEVELTECRSLVKRRGQGEPVAYILGKKDFFDSTFSVGPGVLIPRPETELLVERAIEEVSHLGLEAPRVLDMGSGTGCIPISIVKKVPGATAVAIENSSEAFRFLKENILAHELGERIDAQLKSVSELEEAPGFEVVTANPPYIGANDGAIEPHVKAFEPHHALFGGPEGWETLQIWAKKANTLLVPSGVALFEIGADQAQRAKEIFGEIAAFSEIEVLKDLSGHDRILLARKRPFPA